MSKIFVEAEEVQDRVFEVRDYVGLDIDPGREDKAKKEIASNLKIIGAFSNLEAKMRHPEKKAFVKDVVTTLANAQIPLTIDYKADPVSSQPEERIIKWEEAIDDIEDGIYDLFSKKGAIIPGFALDVLNVAPNMNINKQVELKIKNMILSKEGGENYKIKRLVLAYIPKRQRD